MLVMFESFKPKIADIIKNIIKKHEEQLLNPYSPYNTFHKGASRFA